ncbi:MAG: SH3 domain-containing protein [Anaerolineae bacterium]|nr:MAG: SH3 domain-containing protein [Anaerolineae bacterium]
MYRKQVIVMVIVVSLVVLGSLPVSAQTPSPTPSPEPTAIQPTQTPVDNLVLLARANFRLNVRTGPSTRYAVLGKINPSDVLTITGKLNNGTWLRVQFNDQMGWVSRPLVEVIGDLAGAPIVEAEPDAQLLVPVAPKGATDEVIVITRVNANLRTGPSVDAEILTIIPFSTELTVLGRSTGNNWVQVNFNNQIGWLSSGTLTFTQGNIDNVIVLDDDGNPVPITAQPPSEPTSTPTSAS